MSPFDLIRSRDGSMSLTKLASSTFHVLIAIAVGSITFVRVARYVTTPETPLDAPLFDIAMWSLWASVAVGHAVLDKGTAQIAAYKSKQLDVESGHGALK